MQGTPEITRGAIENIFKSGRAENQPIVQILDLKRISHGGNQNPNAPPRFRLAISDGTHFQQAMIATQLNTLITENKIQVNSLVRLMEVICNTVQDKRIVIILNVQMVGQLPSKFGNPVSIDAVMTNGAQPQQTMQKPSFQTTNGAPLNGMQQNGMQQNGMQQNGMQQNGMQRTHGSGGFQQSGGFNNPPAQQQNRPSFGQGTFGSAKNSWNAAPNPFSKPGGNGAVTKMGTNPSSLFRPIQSINPYQNGWTIRGRCTFKSELRKFQNARGEGSVISFELTDESGSIRITGFTQNAGRINDDVHMNRIYKVSRGFLKQANERFNRSTSSFEMTIDNNSMLEEEEDDGTFMQVKYNFVKIANLESVAVKGNCDVVGIVTSVGPLSEIVIRSTGDPCARRSITVTDDSNASVELTLWRKQAENFLTEDAVNRHPVLVIRNGMRGDFGGVSLNVSRMSTLELDPVNVPEANQLRAWYDSGGHNAMNVQSITSAGGGSGAITGPRKSLMDAKMEDVDPAFSQGSSDASATFITRGMVSFINTNNPMYYAGDPETKKKCIEDGSGNWTSESSNRTWSESEIMWRYVLSMKVADQSASHWMSGFDEVGQVMFGRSAKELRDIKENDPTLYEHIVEDALCRPMLFKVTVKERMWRDNRQIRYTASRGQPLDFKSEGRILLDEIKAYVTAA